MRPEFHLVFWPAATVLAYVCARLSYRRHARWWTSALVLAPALLLALALALHTGYREYMAGSHWLTAMLGPVIVAFALPLYQQRALIRRYWPVLTAGVAVGSIIAGVSAWLLGGMLDLPADLRLSLLPRSVATPFAMTVSSHVGGVPDLTAVFVIVTGVAGAAIGQLVRGWLPLRSALARGALFGMGAHGAGTAKARELAAEEGAVAGLVMVMAGLFNVLVTPAVVAGLLAH
ncbi:LrgB family protein [Achromobacter sp. Marseille-Q0513]|uniref:LrgB family protein n=1 Tax=Achromobacter sp. Marseille-Q0513 TaxID=2829161 RepID=UPI001B96E34C|nr:LrgB family protein [Achromobacter sp. Marseille-Q0513]MBR8652004.1 LrgB family protein [Achromobacter sp. Marseille-Q0513]